MVGNRIHLVMVVVDPLKGRRSPPNSDAGDLLLLALTSSALFIAVQRSYSVEARDATPIRHAPLQLQAAVQPREMFAVNCSPCEELSSFCPSDR